MSTPETRPERATRRHRGPGVILAAFAALSLVLIVGCGTKTEKVAGKSSDTATSQDTADTHDSDSADTHDSDTSDSSDSYDTFDTESDSDSYDSYDSYDSDTGSSDNTWPQEARDQFLASCESPSAGSSITPEKKKAICECALRAIEPQLTLADMARYGQAQQNGDDVSDITQIITAASRECAADPSSH